MGTAGDINSLNAPYRHVRTATESTRIYVFTKFLERGMLERETRERKFFYAGTDLKYDITIQAYHKNTLRLLLIALGRVIRTPSNLVW
jgi:hypothetical protein